MKRSAERETFLAEIIVRAVEGGYSTWAVFTRYRWYMPDLGASNPAWPLRHAPNGGGNAEVTLTEDAAGDGNGLDTPQEFHVTVDSIARALRKIRAGESGIADSYRKRIVEADRENDAGEIDAYDADIVLQMATLGDVIYG